MTIDSPPYVRRRIGNDWLLGTTVVPGASRSGVVGILGDRLKVCVQATAENSKANRAVESCVAAWIGCSPAQVHVEKGHKHCRKTLRITNVDFLPIFCP